MRINRIQLSPLENVPPAAVNNLLMSRWPKKNQKLWAPPFRTYSTVSMIHFQMHYPGNCDTVFRCYHYNRRLQSWACMGASFAALAPKVGLTEAQAAGGRGEWKPQCMLRGCRYDSHFMPPAASVGPPPLKTQGEKSSAWRHVLNIMEAMRPHISQLKVRFVPDLAFLNRFILVDRGTILSIPKMYLHVRNALHLARIFKVHILEELRIQPDPRFRRRQALEPSEVYLGLRKIQLPKWQM